MKKLTMCRICLVQDVRMHSIVHTQLEDMYEKITMMELETKDMRPVQVCYICCARLWNCYRLRMSSLRSEELLKKMLSSNTGSNAIAEEETSNFGFKIAAVVHLSISDSLQKKSDCKIKTETPEILSDIVKMELVEDTENVVEHDSSVDDYVEKSDPEDSLPPQQIKEEIDDKFVTDANVPANPVRSLVREDLEDTSTNRQTNNEPTYSKTIDTNKKVATITNKEVKNKLRDKINKSKSTNNKNEYDNNSLLINKEKLHQCDLCKKTFTRQSNLNVHFRIHSKEKPYKCDICKKHFSQKSSLFTHSQIHANKKPFKCHMCTKSFNRKSNLENHIITHVSDQPYSCDVCKKRFKRKQNLHGHLRRHNSDNTYKCDFCNKIFNQKGHLDVHVRIHTGEKPYKCDICKKSFNIKSNLYKHLRIHSSETAKPFTCDTCNKSFFSKGELVRHIRVHTGERPYKCHLCPKSFAQSGTLNTHVRRHAGLKR